MPRHKAIVRQLQAEDSLAALTDLVHAAYAPHASNGLHFWGTHQTVAQTAERVASGTCLVLEAEGALVGTVLVKPPQPESKALVYRAPDTWSFGQ
jgi:hypothetical protein